MKSDLWARAPEPNHETDRLRMNKLLEALAELSAQIEDESAGLQARYARCASRAALSLQSLEGESGAVLPFWVGDMSGTLARCLTRIAELQGQVAFIEMLRQTVVGYVEDMTPEIAARHPTRRLRH